MRESTLTEYDPPRRRLTGEERRKGILHASRSEFARVGYYGASTASIARVAGCSEPMLYKHFAGKLDLFMKSLEDSIERVYAVFADVAVTGSTIVEQSREFLKLIMSDPGYLELTQLRRIAVTVDEPRVRALLTALEDQVRDRIDIALRIGVEQGVVRRDVDPDYVSFCWLGFMQAACFREALEPGSFRASVHHLAAWLRTLELDISDSIDVSLDVA